MSPDTHEAISSHPPTYLFVTFPVLGVHNGRVLSTDVGGPEVDVRGADRDFEAEQPDGD